MNSETKPDWRHALTQIYINPVVRRIFLLGFSSGLPLFLVFSSLSTWLAEAGINIKTVTMVSWVSLAYGVKVFWAPLVDKVPLPVLTAWLGRRRAWLLLSQLGIILGLLGMAMSDPVISLEHVIWMAIIVAFSSATQDIVIDAYRIEAAEESLQGLLSAGYVYGYRIALIVGGAGALWIADAADVDDQTYQQFPWMVAYVSMAAFMLIGVITTFFSPEPKHTVVQSTSTSDSGLKNAFVWLKEAIIDPFGDFIKRYLWLAILVLGLISIYRISDIVMGVTANPFYLSLGFTKGDIATVSKFFGVLMTLVGVGIGGVAIVRFGVMPILLLGAILSAATNLLFSLLAIIGQDYAMLVATISMDNISAGIATSAFIAYLSSLTNVQYTATQYALFSSFMVLLPKTLAGFSGELVDGVGYPEFYAITAIIGIPVVVLVLLAWRYTEVKLVERT